MNTTYEDLRTLQQEAKTREKEIFANTDETNAKQREIDETTDELKTEQLHNTDLQQKLKKIQDTIAEIIAKTHPSFSPGGKNHKQVLKKEKEIQDEIIISDDKIK